MCVGYVLAGVAGWILLTFCLLSGLRHSRGTYMVRFKQVTGIGSSTFQDALAAVGPFAATPLPKIAKRKRTSCEMSAAPGVLSAAMIARKLCCGEGKGEKMISLSMCSHAFVVVGVGSEKCGERRNRRRCREVEVDGDLVFTWARAMSGFYPSAVNAGNRFDNAVHRY